MDLDKIRDLLSIVAESGVSEVEVEEDEFRVVVRNNAPSIVMQQPQGMPYYGGYPPQGASMAAQQPPSTQAPPQPAAQQQSTPAQPRQSSSVSSQEAAASASEPAAASEDGEEEAGENEELVRAPIVGTFYRRPSPDEEPYVNVGDTVSEGNVLCIIEAMKIMNEIESETSGTIVEVLVDDEEPVEFDQPLFVVEAG